MTDTALTPAAAALATYRRLVADPHLIAALDSAADGHPPADRSAQLAAAGHADGGSVGLDELAVQGARLLTDPAAWLGDAPELVFHLATLDHGGGGPPRPAGQVRLTRSGAPDNTDCPCEYQATDGTTTALRLDAGRLIAAAAAGAEASPLCLYLGFAGAPGAASAAPVLVGNLGDRPALGLVDPGTQQALSINDIADSFTDYWWAWLIGALGFFGIVGSIVAIVRWRRVADAPREQPQGANGEPPVRDAFDQRAQDRPNPPVPEQIEAAKKRYLEQVTDGVDAALTERKLPRLTEPQRQALQSAFEQAFGLPEGDAVGTWVMTWAMTKQNAFIANQVEKFIDSEARPPQKPPRASQALKDTADTMKRLYDEALTAIRQGLTDTGKTKDWIDRALEYSQEGLVTRFQRAIGRPSTTEGENWIADWIRPWATGGRDAYVQDWIKDLPKLPLADNQSLSDSADDLILSVELTAEEAAELDQRYLRIQQQDGNARDPAEQRNRRTEAQQTIEQMAIKTGLQGQRPQTRQERFAELRGIQTNLDRLAKVPEADLQRRADETRVQYQARLEAQRRALAQQEQAAQLQEIADSMQVLSTNAALGVTNEDTKEYEALLQLQTQVAAIDPSDPQAPEQLRSSAEQINLLNASIVLQSDRQVTHLDQSQRLKNQQAEDDYREQEEKIQDLDRQQSPGAHERSREHYTEK